MPEARRESRPRGLAQQASASAASRLGLATSLAIVVGVTALVLVAASLNGQPSTPNPIASYLPKVIAAAFIVVGATTAAVAVAFGIGGMSQTPDWSQHDTAND